LKIVSNIKIFVINAWKTVNNFYLEDKNVIELHDLLKVMGLCDSGGMAKTAIAAGEVQVDGNVELRKRCKIRTGQSVEFQGWRINVI
jgi:ribosome-associated protein